MIRRASINCIITLIILMMLSIAIVDAQTDSLVQQLTEFSENETEIIEFLQHLRENPVNINTAAHDELMRLPFLSPDQADSIIALRETLQQFTSVRQIRKVTGPEVYKLIREFIVIKSPVKKHGQFIHKTQYAFDQPNLPASASGNHIYDYNKIYGRLGKEIQAGLISQKDPGESSYTDYLNGYLSFKNSSWQVILGSFQLRYAEGLMYSRGFSSQKSAEVTLPFRWKNQGSQGTLTSSENSALFGLSAQTPEFYHAVLHVFYSNALRDAQLNADRDIVIGLNYEGYHRTVSEKFRADLIREQILGFALLFNLAEFGNFGALFSNFNYDPGLNFSPKTVGLSAFRRQYYRFSGDKLMQYGLFWNYKKQNLSFSSEFGFSDIGSPGYSASLLLSFLRFGAGVKIWQASRNFQSPYGRIFDDANPFPQAEKGVYFAVDMQPIDDVRLQLYRIFKNDLWRSYFSSSTTVGNEWLLQCDYQFYRHKLRTRVQQKNHEDFIENPMGRLLRKHITQQFARSEIELHPARQIALRTRWEFTRVSYPSERGTYLFQDARFYLSSRALVTARLTVYRTDSYNSRLYEYETDLPGSFSNYALYGEGRVWYLMLRYSWMDQLNIYLKWRQDLRSDENLTDKYTSLHEESSARELRFMLQIIF